MNETMGYDEILKWVAAVSVTASDSLADGLTMEEAGFYMAWVRDLAHVTQFVTFAGQQNTGGRYAEAGGNEHEQEEAQEARVRVLRPASERLQGRPAVPDLDLRHLSDRGAAPQEEASRQVVEFSERRGVTNLEPWRRAVSEGGSRYGGLVYAATPGLFPTRVMAPEAYRTPVLGMLSRRSFYSR